MDTIAGIGATLVIKGELRAEENITIAGRVEGSIQAVGHTVRVQHGATVQADVHATHIVIGGRIIGFLLAEERLELQSTANIEGEISARRLSMAEGAALVGRVQMPA